MVTLLDLGINTSLEEVGKTASIDRGWLHLSNFWRATTHAVGKTASIDRGWLRLLNGTGQAPSIVGKTASIDRGWLPRFLAHNRSSSSW